MKRWVGGTNLLKIKTLFGFHNFVKPKKRYEFVENENQDFVWVSENSETQRVVRLCGKPRFY